MKRPIVAKIRRKRNYKTHKKVSNLLTSNFGQLCDQCNKTNVRLEAHHIIPHSRGGRDTLLNMKYLCETCHALQPNHQHMRK